MATISSPWVGISRGKLGEGVYYHRSGKQCARARNRQPLNPKTAAQALQRMVLGTVSKVAKAYEPIVNHSWEGKAVGSDSVNYFRKLAMGAFRTAAVSGIDPDGQLKADFALKGAPFVGMCSNLPISQGSLPTLAVTLSDKFISLPYATAAGQTNLSATINNQEKYESALKELGCEPGDQLTFVVYAQNPNEIVATWGEESNCAAIVRYSRVTFKAQCPADANAALIDNTSHLNSIFIESSEGVLPGVSADSDGAGIDVTAMAPSGYSLICAATLIRSKKTENGTSYSTAKMAIDEDVFDANYAVNTYPSYMDGADEVQVGDQLYLRNAVARPN